MSFQIFFWLLLVFGIELNDKFTDALQTYVAKTRIGQKSDFEQSIVFAHRFENRINELVFHDNINVSLTAKWLEVARTQVLKDNVKPWGIQEFIGFFEGKTNIPVPRWWKETLSTAEITEDLESATFDLKESLFEKVRHRSGDLWLQNDVSLATGGSSFVLTKNATQYRFDSPNTTEGAVLAFEYRPETMFIVCTCRSDRFPLFRFNPNGTQIWQSEIFAGNDEVSIVGPRDDRKLQNVEIAIHGSRVVVFGASIGRVFCHAFELKSGNSLFWFSTTIERYRGPKEK